MRKTPEKAFFYLLFVVLCIRSFKEAFQYSFLLFHWESVAFELFVQLSLGSQIPQCPIKRSQGQHRKYNNYWQVDVQPFPERRIRDQHFRSDKE
jgi:hypothetical protein